MTQITKALITEASPVKVATMPLLQQEVEKLQ